MKFNYHIYRLMQREMKLEVDLNNNLFNYIVHITYTNYLIIMLQALKL